MRLIHILVPEQEQPDVFSHLEDEGIDFHVFSEDSDTNAVIVQFPLPTPAVEEVLEGLNAAGLEDEYTVVTSAVTVETPKFEGLEDRYAEEPDKDIASSELRTRAQEMGQRTIVYYIMTLLSAVVAAAGLLLNAPAVVVGSMVLAPQVGSALKASVGTVFEDSEMIVDGLRSQVLGLLVAIAGAALFGVAVRWLGVGPTELPSSALEQLHQRVSPGLLAVTIAIAAGFAGALSLATTVPTSLVGVMIAAALIPAAAAVGIGIAWRVPTVAAGAAVLLVVNTAAINLTGIGGLWGLGYRAGDDSRRDTERPRMVGLLRPAVIALIVIAVVLAGSGFLTAQHVAFERTATDSAEEVLSDPEYDTLGLVAVEGRFSQTALLDEPQKVTVVVKRPADAEFPDLAPSLQQRLTARMDRPILVEVEFRDTTVVRPDRAAIPRQRLGWNPTTGISYAE